MNRFFYTHRRWIILGLLTPWFFIGGPDYESARSFKEAWNLGHVIFFALLTFEIDDLFSLCLEPTAGKFVLFLLSVIGLACGIEFFQTLLDGRESSLQDIILGLAGGVSVLLWKISGRITTSWRISYRSCMAGIVFLSTLPLLQTVYDEFRAWQDFPVLADFEGGIELSRWGGKDNIQRVQNPVKSGKYSLQVSLTTEKYSGVGFRFFPQNWLIAQALTFSVFNPGDTVVLYYRIHDWKHKGNGQNYSDRFNGQTYLAPGWNTITVPIEKIKNGPKTRQNDLMHIRAIGFFVADQPEARILYFDDIRLLVGE